MIFCFANSSMGLLFILLFLLYQIGCDNIEDGILIEEKGTCASYGKVVYKMK